MKKENIFIYGIIGSFAILFWLLYYENNATKFFDECNKVEDTFEDCFFNGIETSPNNGNLHCVCLETSFLEENKPEQREVVEKTISVKDNIWFKLYDWMN